MRFSDLLVVYKLDLINFPKNFQGAKFDRKIAKKDCLNLSYDPSYGDWHIWGWLKGVNINKTLCPSIAKILVNGASKELWTNVGWTHDVWYIEEVISNTAATPERAKKIDWNKLNSRYSGSICEYMRFMATDEWYEGYICPCEKCKKVPTLLKQA